MKSRTSCVLGVVPGEVMRNFSLNGDVQPGGSATLHRSGPSLRMGRGSGLPLLSVRKVTLRGGRGLLGHEEASGSPWKI